MKKILCVVLLLGMFGSVCAQRNGRKAEKIAQAEEPIEMVLLQKTQEYLDGFNFSVGTPNYMGKENGPQFFLEEKAIKSFGIDSKKADIKKVFLLIKNNGKNGITVEKTSFQPKKESAKEKRDEGQGKKGKNKDEKIKTYWTTQAETYVKARKGEKVSDAKFEIIFTWVVNQKTKEVEDKLSDIQVSPIPYLESEKKTMEETAQKRVMEYYTRKNMEEISSVDSVVFPSISIKDITLRENNGTYESTKAPEVDIYIMENEERTAMYKLKPSFVVKLGGDFKVQKVNWNPCDTIPLERKIPENSVEPEERPVAKPEASPQDDFTRKQNLAIAFAKNFSTELIAYAKNPTPAGKHLVENMFISHFINIVEVSHISATTPEVIVQRFVKDYLARLRTSDIRIEIDFDGVKWSEDGQRVVFPFKQTFKSATYSDVVVKELHMKSIGELWYAEAVTVVPHTTRVQK